MSHVEACQQEGLDRPEGRRRRGRGEAGGPTCKLSSRECPPTRARTSQFEYSSTNMLCHTSAIIQNWTLVVT
eukprot:11967285-Alexandrium_andersonii.AAC.1